jgi:hypothetical protein
MPVENAPGWRRSVVSTMCLCSPLSALFIFGVFMWDKGTILMDIILATCAVVIAICSVCFCLVKRRQQQSVAASSREADTMGIRSGLWSRPFLDRPSEGTVCPICNDSLVEERVRVRIVAHPMSSASVSVLIKEDVRSQCTRCRSVFHSGCVDDMVAMIWMADRCPMCRQQGIYAAYT